MWYPIGPDFVNFPYDPSLTRARLSRRNEGGRQGAVFAISVGAPRSGGLPPRIYILCIATAPGLRAGSLFRSDDAGLTWIPIYDQPLRQGTASRSALAAIAAHPTVDGQVYAMTESGYLFTSLNGGDLWDSGTQIAPPGEAQLFIALDLQVLAGGTGQPPTRLFASSYGHVVYSDDAMTWQVAGPAVANAETRLARSVWPGQPLYALFINPGDPAAGVYQCDPFASPPIFSQMAGGVTGFQNGRVDSCKNGRVYAYLMNANAAVGFYTAPGPAGTLTPQAVATMAPVPDLGSAFWGLAMAVTPNSPGDGMTDVVLVGTLAIWRTTTAGSGASPWQSQPTDLWHGDQHSFAFLPGPTSVPITLIGCDGGVARSYRLADPALLTLSVPGPTDYGDSVAAPTDHTQSWMLESLNHGLQNNATSACAVPPNYPALTYLSCQDVSLSKGNGALGFRHAYDTNGDGRAVAAAYSPNGVAIWLINGSPFGLFRCLDDGTVNPNAVGIALAGDAVSWGGGTQTMDQHRFAVDSQSRCLAGVLTASGRKLVIRIDSAGTATPIHGDFPQASEPLIISLDPGSSSAYASTEDGRIFYTPDPDGAAGWSDLSSGRPAGVSEVYGLTVSQGSTAFAVAGTSGSLPILYAVSTAGAWTPQTLTPAPAESTGDHNVRLLADPDLATRLYLAQGRKVYQLDNSGGASWNVTDLSDFALSGTGGLPGGYVNDLWVGKAGSHKLLRATVPMRGLWEREVDPPAAVNSVVYFRKHSADPGWITPSAEGMPSPFGTSYGNLGHWQSPDIKVENALSGAPAGYEFQTDPEYPGILTPPRQLDNIGFDMLRSDASAMTPGRAAHVHVQVHNRAFTATNGLGVWVIFCNAASMVPALPAGFWGRFHPDGTIDSTTPLSGGWMAVGPPRALGAPAPSATGPAVVSWDWPQATTIAASSHYCLFAIVHGPTPYSAADQVAATGADPASVDALVPLATQLGQRNVFWLAPNAPPGPPIPWHGEAGVAMISLGFHNPLRSVVRADFVFDGTILPKAARLDIMAAGASARLLASGKPQGATRLPLSVAERARILAAGERDIDDTGGRGFHLRADPGHRVYLSAVALPGHARGAMVVAVRLPEKVQHRERFAIDVVQTIHDAAGRVVTGGAKLLLGSDGRYLD